MRLRQLLTLEGGVAEQGRPITFTLRYLQNGQPMQRQVQAVMFPVGEPAIRRIGAESETADKGLDQALEWTIRFLQASLRDPADLSKLLVEDEADMQALREGLVAVQYGWFGKEYQALMDSEYPDLVTKEDTERLRKEAEDFSSGRQDGPSSS
jgi:hypothetical protein